MKKVSIIIPIFNGEKFLKRCIDSLVSQTLKEIEIIFVNDGSTDNSEKIIKSYNEERIIYRYQEKLGVSIARNQGMDVANGEYIGFVDCDDWVDKDYFKKLYNTAIKYDADIAAGGIIRTHFMRKTKYLVFRKEIYTEDTDEKFILCDVPKKSYVWNKIYKREKLNLQFTPNRLYEDVVFTPRILFDTKGLVTVPNTYYHYWRHNASIVANKSKKAKEDSDYMHKIAKEYIKNNNIKINQYKTKIYSLGGVRFLKIVTNTTQKIKIYTLLYMITWRVYY